MLSVGAFSYLYKATEKLQQFIDSPHVVLMNIVSIKVILKEAAKVTMRPPQAASETPVICPANLQNCPRSPQEEGTANPQNCGGSGCPQKMSIRALIDIFFETPCSPQKEETTDLQNCPGSPQEEETANPQNCPGSPQEQDKRNPQNCLGNPKKEETTKPQNCRGSHQEEERGSNMETGRHQQQQAWNCPANPKNFPVNAQSCSADPQNYSANTHNYAANPQNCPVNPQNFPSNPKNCPAINPNCPAITQNCSAITQNGPAITQNCPANPQAYPGRPQGKERGSKLETGSHQQQAWKGRAVQAEDTHDGSTSPDKQLTTFRFSKSALLKVVNPGSSRSLGFKVSHTATKATKRTADGEKKQSMPFQRIIQPATVERRIPDLNKALGTKKTTPKQLITTTYVNHKSSSPCQKVQEIEKEVEVVGFRLTLEEQTILQERNAQLELQVRATEDLYKRKSEECDLAEAKQKRNKEEHVSVMNKNYLELHEKTELIRKTVDNSNKELNAQLDALNQKNIALANINKKNNDVFNKLKVEVGKFESNTATIRAEKESLMREMEKEKAEKLKIQDKLDKIMKNTAITILKQQQELEYTKNQQRVTNFKHQNEIKDWETKVNNMKLTIISMEKEEYPGQVFGRKKTAPNHQNSAVSKQHIITTLVNQQPEKSVQEKEIDVEVVAIKLTLEEQTLLQRRNALMELQVKVTDDLYKQKSEECDLIEVERKKCSRAFLERLNNKKTELINITELFKYQMKQTKEELQEKCEQINKSLDKSEKSNKELNYQVNTLKQKITHLSNKNPKNNEMNDELKVEADKLTFNIENIRTEKEGIVIEIEQKIGEKVNIEKELVNLRRNLQNNKTEIECTNNQHSELKIKLHKEMKN